MSCSSRPLDTSAEYLLQGSSTRSKDSLGLHSIIRNTVVVLGKAKIRGIFGQASRHFWPNGDFDATGTIFNIDDWITHTLKSILAKNFGS